MFLLVIYLDLIDEEGVIYCLE